MPFRSKAQFRKFFAMAGRGEIPMAKAKEWAHETPNIKALPERVSIKGKKKRKTIPKTTSPSPRTEYAKLLKK